MPNNLDFILDLLDALDGPNPSAALAEAFRAIENLAVKPGYEQQTLHLKMFLNEVMRLIPAGWQHKSGDCSKLDPLMIALATDTFPGGAGAREAALRILFAHPGLLRDRYENILGDFEEEHAAPSCVIRVLRDGVEIAAIPLEGGRQVHQIDRVTSGTYAFELLTGTLLLEINLRREDVEYASAFPGRALDLAAADSTSPQGTPTREISVLSGEIMVNVFPGLESGTLTITLNG